MVLTYSGKNKIENPSDLQIKNGIEDLGNTDDSFAILSKSDMIYIQTSGTKKDGFVLEYQNGSTDKHFHVPGLLTESEVIKAFILYAKGNDQWERDFAWEKQNIDGCLSVIVIFIFSTLVFLL